MLFTAIVCIFFVVSFVCLLTIQMRCVWGWMCVGVGVGVVNETYVMCEFISVVMKKH